MSGCADHIHELTVLEGPRGLLSLTESVKSQYKVCLQIPLGEGELTPADGNRLGVWSGRHGEDRRPDEVAFKDTHQQRRVGTRLTMIVTGRDPAMPDSACELGGVNAPCSS